MESINNEKLIREIEEKSVMYQDEQLNMLKALVSIESGTGNIEGNKKMVRILAQKLECIGANVEIQSDTYGSHVIARLNPGSSKGKILISAHTDTVFNDGDTKRYPFRIEGDYAYGLGISDDKGGITTAYYALKIMYELHRIPDLEIVIIFNCDEEIGSPTSRCIFKDEGKDALYAFVFEPTRENNGIITLRGGIGYYTVEVWGKEAHAGAQFLEGRNAVAELADKVLRIYQMSKIEENIIFNISSIEGGKIKDIPSTIPGYAKARFSIRSMNEDTIQEILSNVRKLESQIIIDGCKVSISGDFVYLPMERERNLPLYGLAREAGKRIGVELEELHTLSGSDANHLAETGTPTIDALGVYEYGMHTFEEHIYIPSLMERTKLFSHILSML